MQTQRATTHLINAEPLGRRYRQHPAIAAYQRSTGICQAALYWMKQGDAWAIFVCVLAIIATSADGWLY
jgi:hypothetical protein